MLCARLSGHNVLVWRGLTITAHGFLGSRRCLRKLNQPISIKYPVRRVSIAVGKYMMIIMYERLSTSETTASFAGA